MRYIFSYAMDLIKLLVIETGIFGYRPKKDLKAPAAALVFTAIYILAHDLTKSYPSYQALTEFLYLITNVITVSLALEGRKKLLISAASYFCMALFDDMFLLGAAKIWGISYQEANTDLRIHYITMFISLLAYTLITRIIMYFRKKTDDKYVDLKESDSRYFLILVASVVSAYAIGMIQENFSALFSVWMIVAVLLAVIIYNNASKKYYENSSHVNEKIKELQKAYYEEMLLRENETRKFRHDIKNHMLCLKTLLDEGDHEAAKEYLANMENRTESLRPAVSTGNDLVNAITSDLMSRYDSVKLNWEGHLPSQTNISDMDICVIFSNILDNAFTAASKCGAGSVGVRIAAAGTSIMITVVNDINEPVQLRASKLVTSKPNKRNHGFGVMNVKECAERNGGKAEFIFDEKHFTTEVILPNAIIL